MVNKEAQIRRDLKDNFISYAKKCLKIRTKNGQLKSFELNAAQKYVHDKLEEQMRDTGKVRAIILKGRQQGISTYVQARFIHKVTHNFGKRAFILTHTKDATNYIFNITKRYYENIPELVKPQTTITNSKELVFGRLDSSYGVSTAGASGTGRGETIQYLHGSEVPLWANAAEHAQGLMQAVPHMNGTEIILEGTAKGEGNYFHQQWVSASKGITEYMPIFIPWFWQDEYRSSVPDDFQRTDKEFELVKLYDLTDEQLVWRRRKMAEFSSNFMESERRFKEEYPCNPIEAFQHASGAESFIPSASIHKARKNDGKLEKVGPLVIGVDPARFGDDRTSIIRRQGRVAFGLESYRKLDTMQVAGIIYKIIREEKPHAVYIDVVGLGAGIVDRLRELGYNEIIKAVNAGSSALDSDLYFNKRAEMWGEMRKWLEDDPASIPDSDSLHADLCAPSYKHDSKHRLVIEKKEEMRSRGIQSPDEAEALILTFSYPLNFNSFDYKKFFNPTINI